MAGPHGESPGVLAGVWSRQFHSGLYLLHKLPEASEEIHDPHNFLLEVWASGGPIALAALVFGLALAFRNLLAGGEETAGGGRRGCGRARFRAALA